MHILCLTPEVDLNHDARGFIHTWMEALAKRCSKLSIMALHIGHTNLPLNADLYSLNFTGHKLLFLLRFYKELLRILRRKEVDVIFVHMIPIFAILAAPVALLWRKPVIMWYTHGAISNTLRLAHLLVNKVVTASEESFRIQSRKKIVVGHGINTDYFKPATPCLHNNTIKLLSIGRISPSKDYETVIRALLKVVENTKMPIQYLIIGKPFPNTLRDEKYYQELKQLVHDLQLEKTVKFIGSIPHSQILPYYQQCDIFINPSLTGSLDKTGLEAMACAKPVFSCNESYLPIFGNYKDMLFFKTRDSNDLAKKILIFSQQSNDTPKKIGQDLRTIVVQHHNLNRLMDRFVNIFTHAIRN